MEQYGIHAGRCHCELYHKRIVNGSLNLESAKVKGTLPIISRAYQPSGGATVPSELKNRISLFSMSANDILSLLILPQFLNETYWFSLGYGKEKRGLSCFSDLKGS